jgi:hypothetical protein
MEWISGEFDAMNDFQNAVNSIKKLQRILQDTLENDKKITDNMLPEELDAFRAIGYEMLLLRDLISQYTQDQNWDDDSPIYDEFE